MFHFLCAAIGIACVCLAPLQDAYAGQPAGPPNPEIWLAPQGLHPSRPQAADFMAMFEPNAPWQSAASHTQVFKFYAGYLLHLTQEKADIIVGELNRRGLAIALESGVINVPPNPPSGCGGWGNVEGYGTVAMARRISQLIKAAHGTIKYIAMDEPLYYGHYYTQGAGKGAGCHTSIPDIVQLSKQTLDAYMDEFPRVLIGDIEPPLFVDGQPDWQGDLSSWAQQLRVALGHPLAFLHLDVEWNLPKGVPDALTVYDFGQELHQRGLLERVGIIYNGTLRDTSDDAWVKAARDHVLIMEGQHKLRPDQVVFQSWNPHPTHAMPDAAQDTLTSLVTFYFNPATQKLRGGL